MQSYDNYLELTRFLHDLFRKHISANKICNRNGSPKCMPSGFANVIVDSVRFQRQRKGKMAEYGKIALDTYNTGKWIDVSDEDRKLIDDILKGCMPT